MLPTLAESFPESMAILGTETRTASRPPLWQYLLVDVAVYAAMYGLVRVGLTPWIAAAFIVGCLGATVEAIIDKIRTRKNRS